jgi:hypothetical protein
MRKHQPGAIEVTVDAENSALLKNLSEQHRIGTIRFDI